MDEVLFRYSYDYVGDLAETISLVWEPAATDKAAPPDLSLGAVMHQLETVGRANVHGLVRDLLDDLEGSSRFAFLKLITGGLRIGVSARLVKQALADMGNVDVTEIETLWHGLSPPLLVLVSMARRQGGQAETRYAGRGFTR